MNILFPTIAFPDSMDERNIYTDLMEELRDRGHNIHVVASCERRFSKETKLVKEKGIQVLRVKTLNIKGTKNPIEKGLGTLLVDLQFRKAIDKYWSKTKFDLVLYPTPPITLDGVVRYIKQRDQAKSYLLLKDIFPQNAVDIGLIKKGSLLHKYFATREKKIYMLSDYIGCMSQANVDYLKERHPYLEGQKIEVCPNSIRPKEMLFSEEDKATVRERYNIPGDAVVFVYGGNLGKPQGIHFLQEILEANANRSDAFFLVAGSGTEYDGLSSTITRLQAKNIALFPQLPKKEYDDLLDTCDVGMIFLDPRFTIPNFPSRLLAYLEGGKPVIAATDKTTDIGKVITESGFGFWCESGDLDSFNHSLDRLSSDGQLRAEMGSRSRQYLVDHYTVSTATDIILDHFSGSETNVQG